MIIEETTNGDLEFDTENFEELNQGVVIFPETLEEVELIKAILKCIKN